jgi:hypothetical protein
VAEAFHWKKHEGVEKSEINGVALTAHLWKLFTLFTNETIVQEKPAPITCRGVAVDQLAFRAVAIFALLSNSFELADNCVGPW